jgi:hypothetical protein
MPTFDIKGKKGVGVKQSRKKINHSYFGCLLNTNYKPKTKDEITRMGEQYPKIMEEALTPDVLESAITIVDNITTLPDGRKTFETHKITHADFEEQIKHIRSRFKCEIGNDFGKGGRFHLHASFFIVHTTKIQMDMQPIVNAVNEILASKGLPLLKYFHIKSEKPTTDLYMTKYDYT